jgi:hypothetical protein
MPMMEKELTEHLLMTKLHLSEAPLEHLALILFTYQC